MDRREDAVQTSAPYGRHEEDSTPQVGRDARGQDVPAGLRVRQLVGRPVRRRHVGYRPKGAPLRLHGPVQAHTNVLVESKA